MTDEERSQAGDALDAVGGEDRLGRDGNSKSSSGPGEPGDREALDHDTDNNHEDNNNHNNNNNQDEGAMPSASGGDGSPDPLDRIAFPKSLLKRIVKEHLEGAGGGVDARKAQISKECLEAFDEAARVFIHYVTWSANEEVRTTSRQTIGVEDVLKGLEEAEFGEFVEPLRAYARGLEEERKSKRQRGEQGPLDVGATS